MALLTTGLMIFLKQEFPFVQERGDVMKQRYLVIYVLLSCLLLLREAAAVTVSLGNANGCEGQPVSVLIGLSGAGNVASFGMDVTFDAEKLTFLEVRSGNDTNDWAVIGGQIFGKGVLRIGGFSGSGTPVSGDGSIARIRFMVETAGPDSTSLTAQNLVDGITGADTIDGNVTILEVCPSPTPTHTPSPTPSPTPTPTSTPIPGTPTLVIGDTQGCKGGVVTVAINVRSETNISAFGMDLKFDGLKVAYHGIRTGADTADWASVSGMLATTETLRLGGFCGGGNPVAGNGELARVDFIILAHGPDSTTLSATNLLDGLKSANVNPGIITILETCPTLTPTPTPAATPTPSLTPTPTPTPLPTPEPDLILGQAEGCIGGSARIPLNISKAAGMVSFGLDIAFDDQAISFHRVTAGDETLNWASVGGNLLGPGNLRVGGFSGSDGGLTGDAQIAQIEFYIRATTPQTVTLVPGNMIDGISNAHKTDGAIEIIVCATPTPLPVWGNVWMLK